MSTKAQANTELELGPLEAHELEIVSGGYNTVFPGFLGGGHGTGLPLWQPLDTNHMTLSWFAGMTLWVR